MAPIEYSHPTEAHQVALTQAIEIANAHPEAKGFLVIDLDDTRDDTRPVMQRKLNTFFRRTNPDKKDELPSLDEVTEKGTRASYAPLVGDGFYEAVYDYLEQRPNHFKLARLMDPQFKERLDELQEAGFIPILWLSARNKANAKASQEFAAEHNLPEIPIYTHFPGNKHVVMMKTRVLLDLVQAIHNQRVYMIDDNADLIVALDNLGHKQICGVKYFTRRFAHVQTKLQAVWGNMLERLEAEYEQRAIHA